MIKNFDLRILNGKLQLADESIINDKSTIDEALNICEKEKNNPLKFNSEKLKQVLSQVHCQEDNNIHLLQEIPRWMRRPEKTRPLVLLFAGTSGTGKTFTAKLIAESLKNHGYRFLRIDMNEYSSEADSWKFIGSSVGHIGSDEDSPIFAARRNCDKLVILFDEIEKAHLKVFRTMMQLLEEGRLADGKGRQADFKKSILIFTSNLAMDQLITRKNELMKVGKISPISYQDEMKSILRNNGLPSDLSGRIDWLLVYNQLDHKNVATIAIQEIRKMAVIYNIRINRIPLQIITDIAIQCANNNEGARPVRRIVTNLFEGMFQDYEGQKPITLDILHDLTLSVCGQENICSVEILLEGFKIPYETN